MAAFLIREIREIRGSITRCPVGWARKPWSFLGNPTESVIIRFMLMYKTLIRPLFFRIDPEHIHHISFKLLRFGLSLPLVSKLIRKSCQYKGEQLKRELWGLSFNNPIGLAAGFDKDALLGDKWKDLGFGFIELGTVTPRPQSGNPKKRLFRLPKDEAIINRMGFNNAGVEAMVERLKKIDKGGVIIGVNIGKNKNTPNEQAVDDYEICFQKLFDYVDYFVVNVSSPNTPGLRSLQEKEPLTLLLERLQALNQAHTTPKPLLLKIAPDLTTAQLDDIIEVAQLTRLSGLIATNTTISRDSLSSSRQVVEAAGKGGLSGKPLTVRANEVMQYLAKHTQGKLPLVGVGGIMKPEDAHERFQSGASLVQIYTGFVYEGPGFVKQILTYLNHHSTD